MRKAIKRHQFSMCACLDNMMYLFTNSSNMCMRMNLDTYEMTYVKEIENANIFEGDLADGIEVVNDKIYQLGIQGDSVYEIDIDNQNCKRIKIDCHSASWGNYAAYAHFGQDIFVFPSNRKKIVRISTITRTVEYDSKLYDQIEQYYVKNGYEPKNIINGCKVDELMWLITEDGKIVVSYNLENREMILYELPIQVDNCQQIVHYNQKFYLLQGNGKIYVWDTEKIWLLFDIESKYKKNDEYFRMAITEKNIYVLPSLGENIMLYNMDSCKLKKIDNYPKDFFYCVPKGWSKFYGYCETIEWYYFAMRSTNYMLTINKVSGEVKWIKPIFPTIDEDVEAQKGNSVSLYCEEEWNLESYLQIVYFKEGKSGVYSSNNNGEVIWKAVK